MRRSSWSPRSRLGDRDRERDLRRDGGGEPRLSGDGEGIVKGVVKIVYGERVEDASGGG